MNEERFLLYKGEGNFSTIPRPDLLMELGARKVQAESLKGEIARLTAELQKWENWHDGQRKSPPRRRREIPSGWRVVVGKQA